MFRTFIKLILFRFDPEKSHEIAIKLIKWVHKIPLVPLLLHKLYTVNHPCLVRTVFGIEFSHPVGLAAGFDKDAKIYQEMANIGFSFIEIGTVTPKCQFGNPPKRLFRLIEDNAIINRMGFNNEGVEAARLRLLKNRGVIIGGNIGKNKSTLNEEAINDYRYSFNALFDVVDYFVVNVSSPNTPNLRDLQEKKPLTTLLNQLQYENNQHDNPKPILLKIAPDLTDNQLMDIIDIIKDTQIAGVIATNTTISRDELISKNKHEIGGLSGKPLKNRSTEVIRFLAKESNYAFPIIGVGGIHSASDAIEKLEAGASLVQLYTGFIYEGPKLIRSINKKIIQQFEEQNIN